ncbi:alpha/beta hydrolase [Pseudonocardia ailaonensis]|uniref:alpha/beta fold hydrolase n=1 Tax=Pseudonocardia ailaonensis TaxID=367279 RepID=UPI0031DA5D5F
MNVDATTSRIEVPSGDLTLSVQVAGTGPLVILMHGWPELGLSWRHQVAPLAAAGHTVAVPDMRGFGGSGKPADVGAYDLDSLADDMAAVAAHLGARTWVAVGDDWGAFVAWRCALRFPDAVRGVFSIGVPYIPSDTRPRSSATDTEGFFYVRYFQEVGLAEAELEADVHGSLRHIFFALSGGAPQDAWLTPRPATSRLREGLVEPPPGPLSFLPDDVLERFAAAYRAGGFFGPVSWYRNGMANAAQAAAYGDGRIRQPAGFLAGEREIVLSINPDGRQAQRALIDDLRVDRIVPDAGHWLAQERPAEVTATLLEFLAELPAPVVAR